MARWLVLLSRVIGAALLGTTAGIHAYLWQAGYRSIHVIGPLFLANVVGASVLCLAVLVLWRPLLAWAAAAGALLELGTLVGLVITVRHGLFGFVESTRATLFWESVYVEIAGTVVLAVLAMSSIELPAARRPGRRAFAARLR